MGILMIKCPATGRDIPTGIETDGAPSPTMPVFFSRTYCPFCRTNHEWFAKQAWVREEARRQNARLVISLWSRVGPQNGRTQRGQRKPNLIALTRCTVAKWP